MCEFKLYSDVSFLDQSWTKQPWCCGKHLHVNLSKSKRTLRSQHHALTRSHKENDSAIWCQTQRRYIIRLAAVSEAENSCLSITFTTEPLRPFHTLGYQTLWAALLSSAYIQYTTSLLNLNLVSDLPQSLYRTQQLLNLMHERVQYSIGLCC